MREEHCRQKELLNERPYIGSEPGRAEGQQGDKSGRNEGWVEGLRKA